MIRHKFDPVSHIIVFPFLNEDCPWLGKNKPIFMQFNAQAKYLTFIDGPAAVKFFSCPTHAALPPIRRNFCAGHFGGLEVRAEFISPISLNFAIGLINSPLQYCNNQVFAFDSETGIINWNPLNDPNNCIRNLLLWTLGGADMRLVYMPSIDVVELWTDHPVANIAVQLCSCSIPAPSGVYAPLSSVGFPFPLKFEFVNRYLAHVTIGLTTCQNVGVFLHHRTQEIRYAGEGTSMGSFNYDCVLKAMSAAGVKWTRLVHLPSTGLIEAYSNFGRAYLLPSLMTNLVPHEQLQQQQQQEPQGVMEPRQ
jgi:hypothetical protein